MSSLFEVLKQFEADRWSGEISVTSSQGNAELLISEGALLWAHRPLDRAVERLSKFSWIQLPPDESLRGIRTWEEFVRILLRTNHDSYQQLVRLLKTDRLELFFRIFFWTNIELTPRAFPVSPPDQADLGFYSPKSLGTLLKEAKRRTDEWPRIQKQIGSSKRIFVCTVEIPTENNAPLDAIDEAFLGKSTASARALPYSYEEIEILKASDGTNSVQDIVRLSPDGEFLTLRRILRLWERGALAPKDDDSQVIHPQIVLRRIGMKDGARALLLLVVFLIAAGLTDRLLHPPVMQSEDAHTIQQSLELYRLKYKRYPLTLNELSTFIPLPEGAHFGFSYSLIHPTEYELRFDRFD